MGTVELTIPSEPQIERRKKRERDEAGLCMTLLLRRAFRFPISGAVRTQRPTLPTFNWFRRHG